MIFMIKKSVTRGNSQRFDWLFWVLLHSNILRKVKCNKKSVTREIKHTDQIGLEKLRFDWLVTLVTIKHFGKNEV